MAFEDADLKELSEAVKKMLFSIVALKNEDYKLDTKDHSFDIIYRYNGVCVGLIRAKNTGVTFKSFHGDGSYEVQKYFHYVESKLRPLDKYVATVKGTSSSNMNRELRLKGAEQRTYSVTEAAKLTCDLYKDIQNCQADCRTFVNSSVDYDSYSPMADVFEAWYATVGDKQQEVLDFLNKIKEIRGSSRHTKKLPPLAIKNEKSEEAGTVDAKIRNRYETLYKSCEEADKENTNSVSYREVLIYMMYSYIKKQKSTKPMNKQSHEKYWIYRAESEDLAVDLDNQKLAEGDKIVCYYAEPGKPIRLSVMRVNPGEIAPECIYQSQLCGTKKTVNSLRTTLINIKPLENKLISKNEFDSIEQAIKKCSYSLNRILFGAPGTGKSYQLKEDVKSSCLPEAQVERVTFHPEYSYFDFVGAYKPKMKDERIVYDFVPGPFARTLKKALLNKDRTYLLIIEEINRARVAAVFGDMFQLLDRDETGASEYGINPSEELKDFLEKEGLRPEDIEKIRIPGNMYIWATMNSADQGVYPMDTAFKRRWNFEYTGIDDGVGNVGGKFANDWKSLRKHVNELLQKAGINEDKQMGPFFLKGAELDDREAFVSAVKNKVLMYLFEDAAKHKRTVIFNLKSEEMRYSTICEKFVSKYKDEEPAKSTEAPEASEKMKMALEALFKPVASAKVESKSGASPNSAEGEPTNAE